MHFFKVPRLGSYLAIRLEYRSCLFEDSLDAAVQDHMEVRQRQKEQEDEKRSFMEKLSQEEKEAEKEGDSNFDSHAIASNRKWEEIRARPFKT